MKLSTYMTLCVCLIASACYSAPGSTNAHQLVTSTTTVFSEGLAGELEKIAADHKGVMGIYCRHLENGEVYAVNSDEPFPTASTIKVAVMAAALDLLARGEGPYKSYYDTRTYAASTSTGGSGFLQNYKNGTRVELKELIHLMITVSDNIATNMICDWIGLEKVNNWLASCGFQETRMFSTVGGSKVFDVEGRKTWGLGRTTPREMGNLMASIVTGKAGTTSTTEEMLRLLGNQYFDNSIPAGVPPTVYVGSKSGSLSRSRSDTAIIAAPTGSYVLAVFTKENEDTSWKNDNEAEVRIQRISAAIWRHFNPDNAWERPEGADKF